MMEVEFRGLGENRVWHYGLPSYGRDNQISEIEVKCCGEFVKVIPETIGQYIGIKDIHQKKVFQGDIVKVRETIYTNCGREEIEGIREYTGEVVLHQYGWYIAEKILGGIRYHSLWLWNIECKEGEEDDTMKILGNRWDNPEMAVIKE